MKRTILLVALLASGVLLAAPATAQEPRTIGIEIQIHRLPTGNFHLLPESINAHVGDTIVANVINTDAEPHNLVFCSGPVEGTSCPSRFAFVPPLPGKTNRTITFEVTEPGTFEYFCDILGHRQAGMKGEMTIQGAATKESPGPAVPLALLALAGLALALRRK